MPELTANVQAVIVENDAPQPAASVTPTQVVSAQESNLAAVGDGIHQSTPQEARPIDSVHSKSC